MKIYYYSFSLLLLAAATSYSASTAAEDVEKKSTPAAAKKSERHPTSQPAKKLSLGIIPEDKEYDCKGDVGHIAPITEGSESEEDE